MSMIQNLIRRLQETPRRLFIDGRWVEADTGRTFATVNPANGRELARIALGGAADVDLAVAAARRAFEGPWRRARPADRQALLLAFADLVERHFDELSALDTLEMGAPLTRSRNMRSRVIGRIRYYAGLATAIHGQTIDNSLPSELLSYTLREPVGVVGAIIPWNGPLGATIWKLGPVLATGCTMVLKPAEEASLSALCLVELLQEAGLPGGVVNVVTGTGEDAGAAIAAHPGVDKVAFTGSHLTGQKIVLASAGNLKRLSLELGGKSPNIVFADADLEKAVPAAAMAALNNSGQICSAGTRLFVQRAIYDDFIERLRDFAGGLRVGDGLDPQTQIGPLVSAAQLDRVTGYIKLGRTEGARILLGGTRLTEGGMADGYFVAPTIFDQVDDGMRICREEIFGPVLSVLAFEDEDEAVRRGNATMFGLAAGIWTRDIGRANRVAQALNAGTVWINCFHALDPAVPFGGNRMSGYGRESGIEHLDEFLSTKAVWTSLG